MTVRVVVADDQASVRTGLAMILDAAPDVEVVAEVADGAAAVAVARRLRPDVVLMDVRMPGTDGIEATRMLVTEGVCDVLVLTTFDVDDYVDGALAAGAAGFLLKTVAAPRLVEAVRAVAAGGGALAPEVTRRVLAQAVAGMPPAARPLPGLERLTARELDVLRCLGRGRSNVEIASDLVITEGTVKTHVSRVLAKLGLTSRTQAAIAAQQAGLVSPQPGG